MYCWARGSDRTDCVKGDQLFCNLYGRFIPVGRTRWALKMIIVKMQKGYSDPTACEALRNIEREEERFHKLLDTIFTLCELSDFHVEERIVIKDKRTGRIWR